MENVDDKEEARDGEDSAREIGMVSPYLPALEEWSLVCAKGERKTIRS